MESRKNLTVIGIIPARGGSKGIPLKNIKELHGKPLIEYTIKAARASGTLDRLIVSTDSTEIAAVAEAYQTKVILRPPELATDSAPTEGALLHVIEDLEKKDGFVPDIVLTLEPTSPLRAPETIKECVDIFRKTSADSVIGVVETRSCYGKIKGSKFDFLFKNQARRRQNREPLYRESSTIYATRTEVLKAKGSVLGDSLYPLIVSEYEAIDINNDIDFEIAEFMMTKKKDTRR